MSDEGKGDGGPGSDPAITGRIVLAFPAGKPTDPTLVVEGVTPGQVFLSAYLLDLVAHEIRTGQLMQAASGAHGIALPGMDDVARVVQELGRQPGRN